jgi:phosphate transport system permease protein
MSTLSLQIFTNAVTGYRAGQARAWAGALTLIIIVLTLTIAAHLLRRTPSRGRS